MNKVEKVLQQVVRMVSETLSLDEVSVETNVPIQNLGLTSVTLVKLTDRISEALSEEVRPGVFFEYETLEKFVTYLFEHKPEATKVFLSKISKNGSPGRPLSPGIIETEADTPQQSPSTADQAWAHLDAEFFNSDSPSPMAVSEEDETPENVPVIIGGGLGGMLISRQLSQNKIPHILVGKPLLGDSPKLGESMTELVSIEFSRNLKNFKQYFFCKEASPFFMGDMVAGARFDAFYSFISIFLEGDKPKTFIHLDRIGFDQALYDEVSQAKECHWIDEFVTDLEYDKETDQVKSIVLKNQQRIIPSFVWDCTNHIRLLGRKLKIPYKNFDPARQVFFTHYFKKDSRPLCGIEEAPWIHATSLLQSRKDFDGLQGISWVIPLGSYVSVGISMAPEDVEDKTPEEVMALLTKAYQNRGLNFTQYFPRRKEIINVPTQHFAYDRFVGKNWALVGGSAINAWFTSGSNVSIVACMATMADKIIKQPEIYGEHYTRHAKGFIQTQHIYDTLLTSDIGAIDAMKFLSGIIEQGRKRVASYFMFRLGLDSEAARTARALWEEDPVIDNTYFEFLRTIATHAAPKDRKQQTSEIFKRFADMKQKNEKLRSGTVTLPHLRANTIRTKRPELFLQIDELAGIS